jgi:CBS domain-containing protein
VASVAELMHRDLISCPPGTPLGEVAALLRAHDVHGLLVTDADGAVRGVVSDRDVLAGEWLATDEESLGAMRAITAGDLMSTPVETLSGDASIDEAASRMRTRNVSRLVVTQGGAPLGVVSVSDVVASLAPARLGRERVADVMSWGFLACRPQTPVTAAARAMTERSSRSLVVLGDDGGAAGVVTGHDLLRLAEGSAGATTVADLMQDPITIRSDATLREAADRMLEHDLHRLVVCDADEAPFVPLGIVSTTDIMVQMAAPGSVWRT